MPSDRDKIQIENVNFPGKVERVDRAKYVAMREALLAVLPGGSPGLTAAETKAALLPLLPHALFPEGAKAGWWLNLETSVDRLQHLGDPHGYWRSSHF